MHKAHVSWLISASITGSTLEDVPYPEWCQFLKHLPSLMHLHGETISVKKKKKKIPLPAKVEKWMRVRLYRNFARHSIRKVEEKQSPFFLLLLRSIKHPLRRGKQQTRLSFYPEGKVPDIEAITERSCLSESHGNSIQDKNFPCPTLG